MRIEIGNKFHVVRKQDSFNRLGTITGIVPLFTLKGNTTYEVTFTFNDGKQEKHMISGTQFEDNGFERTN